MKLRNHSPVFFTMLLLGTVAFLSGCATTGMDRSVKTSNSIQDVDKEIRKLIAQIDVTGTSLDALVSPANPDLKKSFNTYTDDLANLDSEGKRVIKRMDEMKSKSTAYFAEWEKQGMLLRIRRSANSANSVKSNWLNSMLRCPQQTQESKVLTMIT